MSKMNLYTPGMICQMKECPHKADTTIFGAFRVHANHPPAIAGPLVHLCGMHALEATFDQYFPPDNWEKVCAIMKQNRMQEPVREFCYLELRPIT